MAFLAINIASVQNANAQVNKLREQAIQATKEGNKTDNQVKPDETTISVQNANEQITKQREKIIQAMKKADTLGDQVKIAEEVDLQEGVISTPSAKIQPKHTISADSTAKNVEPTIKLQKLIKVQSIPK